MTMDASPQGLAQAHLEIRRARLLSAIDRDARPVGGDAEPLTPAQLESLLADAEELYHNDLAWEELTDEEEVTGGRLTELVFPGFLPFVEGLLVEEVPADSLAPARPRPDAVEAILSFLAERYTELTAELEGGIDSERVVWARAMTAHLIDLVLYRLYALDPSEREAVEALD